MIELYVQNDCPACDAVRNTLEDLTLAHRVITVDDPKTLPLDLPSDAHLPVLVDDGKVVYGREALQVHLQYLRDFKAQWEKFQSDACYGGEDGCIL